MIKPYSNNYVSPGEKRAYNVTTFDLVRFRGHWHPTRYCVLQHKVSPPKYDSLTRARVNPGLTSPGPRLSLAVLGCPPTRPGSCPSSRLSTVRPGSCQSFPAIHRPPRLLSIIPATHRPPRLLPIIPGYPSPAPAPANHPGYPIPSDSCSRVIDLNCRRRPIRNMSSCAVGATRLTAAWPVPTYRDHPTLTRGI